VGIDRNALQVAALEIGFLVEGEPARADRRCRSGDEQGGRDERERRK